MMLDANAAEQLPAPLRCPAQVTVTIPVEELRRLIRGDVEAVVRAELRAELGGTPGRRSSRSVVRWPCGGRQAEPPEQPAEEPAASADGGSDGGLWVSRESAQPLMCGHGRGGLVSTPPGPGSPGIGGSPQSVAPSASQKTWMGLLQSDRDGGYDMLLQDDTQESFEEMTSEFIADMGSPMMTRAVRCLDMLWSLQEKPRTGWCAEVVQSSSFQAFFACVIAANATVMVFSVNHDVQNISSAQDTAGQWFKLFDVAFLILYCTELVFKLAVHRLFYFWNDDAVWNWLDFLLVMQSLTDFVVQGGGGGRGNTWMRTVRLFRIAKVLRILRVMKFFTQLHLIMSAIIGSILSLFWSMMVFVLLFLIFSLYFVSSVAAYLGNEDSGGNAPQDVLEDFGSVQVCMLTLFMTLSGGNDWAEYYDLLKPIGMPGFVFVLFVAFGQIALLNVVTGLFVENAMKLSEPDVHQKAEDQLEQDREYAKELTKLFKTADKDGGARLSKDEFEAILKNGRLINLFRYLGINPAWSKKNLPLLFDQMVEQQQNDSQDWGSRDVDPDTFVEKCMALRGAARSTEVMELHDMLLRIQDTQEVIRGQLQGGPWHHVPRGPEAPPAGGDDAGAAGGLAYPPL